MSSPEFDINAWEAGHYNTASATDAPEFDINAWENGNVKAAAPADYVPPTTTAAKPQAPEYNNPLPTENIPVVGAMIQPVAELGENLVHDPAFRNTTAANAGVAAGATGAAALPAVTPEALAALSTLAAQHPAIAHVVGTGLKYAAASTIGGALTDSIKGMIKALTQ